MTGPDLVVVLAATLPPVVVLARGWALRPRQGRTLLAGPSPWGPGPSLVLTVGGAVRRALGRPRDVEADRRLGHAIVLALPLSLVSPVPALAVGALWWLRPVWVARRAERFERAQVVVLLPDVVDLLHVAIRAGLTAPLALGVVAPLIEGRLGVGLRSVERRVALGERFADALDGLGEHAGEATRSLVAALQSAERYGTPLAPALGQVATEARARRRRHAEVAARQLPVRLLFPLVLCTLPAFALLTVVPLLVGSLPSLRP